MNRRSFIRGTVSVLAVASLLKGRVNDSVRFADRKLTEYHEWIMDDLRVYPEARTGDSMNYIVKSRGMVKRFRVSGMMIEGSHQHSDEYAYQVQRRTMEMARDVEFSHG